VGVNLAQSVSLEFGYRWLDIDYTSGEDDTLFTWDVLTQGPVFGVAFRF
jgi:opacity protein-like surface antigen